MPMRTRLLPLHIVIGLVLVLALGACARSFGDGEAASEQAGTEDANHDSGATSTTTATSGSSPSSGPAKTTPPDDTKPVGSKGPPTVPPGDGFEGDPPSFPSFTFTATRGANGTVTVTGSGCAGGYVQLYPSPSASGESSDPIFADPDSSGNWSTSAKIPAGTLDGKCVGLGSSGQTRVGGSHTVTVG